MTALIHGPGRCDLGRTGRIGALEASEIHAQTERYILHRALQSAQVVIDDAYITQLDLKQPRKPRGVVQQQIHDGRQDGRLQQGDKARGVLHQFRYLAPDLP